jgi:hypothetical protein
MRSGTSFLLSLLVIAAGIGLFFYGGTMNGSDPLALPLVVAGGVLALAGIVMLIFAWRGSDRRAYAQALAAPDTIARWQVYPSDMEAFRAVDAARAGRLWSLKNSLKLPGSVPPEGFPIVVGPESLVVADKLYRFGIKSFGPPGDVTWHEGEPGFIEVTSELPTTKTPRVVVMRIPVPASARHDAAAAFAHFDGRVSPQARQRIHSRFPSHFEAVRQTDDSPHRLKRRGRIVLPLIGLFCLAMLIIIFLRPF